MIFIFGKSELLVETKHVLVYFGFLYAIISKVNCQEGCCLGTVGIFVSTIQIISRILDKNNQIVVMRTDGLLLTLCGSDLRKVPDQAGKLSFEFELS